MLPKVWSNMGAYEFWFSVDLYIVQFVFVLLGLLNHWQFDVSKSQSNSCIEVSGVVDVDVVVLVVTLGIIGWASFGLK